jgi:MYXO-CTERM domain-containing protein
MDCPEPPNPFEVAIAVAVGSASYWVRPFLTTDVPLWGVGATLLLGLVVLVALGALRRRREAGRERERREEERHEEILERLDRLGQPAPAIDEEPSPLRAGGRIDPLRARR